MDCVSSSGISREDWPKEGDIPLGYSTKWEMERQIISLLKTESEKILKKTESDWSQK